MTKRALVVDDGVNQGPGVCSHLRDIGGYDIDLCVDVESALKRLDEIVAKHEEMYSLVLSDMQLPQRPGDKVDRWAGANLLHIISKNYSQNINLVLYTCKYELPNSGDLRQLYQAGASAIYGPEGIPPEVFLAEFRLAIQGTLTISRAFRDLARLAADPENGCPFDPVQYYCIRLIAENRGRDGAAEEWNRARGSNPAFKPITWNQIDALLEEIYEILSDELKEEDFQKFSPDQKNHRLSRWYWNTAIPRFGAAVPVNYEPPQRRRNRYRRV